MVVIVPDLAKIEVRGKFNLRIAYFDAFSGIAGDMTVAALIDAGADATVLTDGLASLGTDATFTVEKAKRAGIAGTRFVVDAPEENRPRHLRHIDKMIDESGLPARTRERAKKVFLKLGEAEASVHGIELQRVHFHEVGAVDSICDIVGACYGLDLLGIERIYMSNVNVGSGTVKCDHGLMPVPAPATAKLLAGYPTYSSGPTVELTTPTGAAFAAALAETFGPMPAMKVEKIGFGAGTKDFPGHSNMLRVMVGEASAATEAATVTVIEANIDDTTPQVLGYTMDRLFEEGALDVALQPLQMKKNRQGTLLRVIARPEDQEKLASLILAETTSLGVRLYSAQRRVLERHIVPVRTPYGEVRMKVSAEGSASPEYDDCQKLARERRVPLKDVIAAAHFAFQATR
jgi:uncharacterized protein (TIGR00299 family) protein